MPSISLIDGHTGHQHVFSAENEDDFRTRVEESTEVSAECQIVLIKKKRATRNAGETDSEAGPFAWAAFTGAEISAVFAPVGDAAVDEAEQIEMVCFDRRKIGGEDGGAATAASAAIPKLEPDVVLLPSQQTVFNAEEADYEASCLASPAVSEQRQGYLRRFLEIRLFLLNLHSAAATIAEGGQERLQSIRLALSQHDRLNLAFGAVTSQTKGKCSLLASEGQEAEKSLQQTLVATALIATEAPAWMERLASIPLHKELPHLSAYGADGMTKEEAATTTRTSLCLADTLPPGHFARLNDLLAQCKGQAQELISELRDSALPSLTQQQSIFNSVSNQAQLYAVGRREAFASLVGRAESDVDTQKKARSLVDAAFRDAVRACEVLLADISASSSTPMPGAETAGGNGGRAEGQEEEGEQEERENEEGREKPSEEDVKWALGLLSTAPFSDGAIDSAASSLASSDSHLSSLQQQAHTLLVEAASAVNSHLSTVAVVQSAASTVAGVAADLTTASQALAAVCGELQHLRSLPAAYEALMAEERRRKAFDRAVASAARFINAALASAVEKEKKSRDDFLSRFSLHLPGSLLFDLESSPASSSSSSSPRAKEGDETTSLPSSFDGMKVAVAVSEGNARGTSSQAAWRPLFPSPASEEPAESPAAAGAPSLEETLKAAAEWRRVIELSLSTAATTVTSAAAPPEGAARPRDGSSDSEPTSMSALALAYRCALLESTLASVLPAVPPSLTVPSSRQLPLEARFLRLEEIGKALLSSAESSQGEEAGKESDNNGNGNGGAVKLVVSASSGILVRADAAPPPPPPPLPLPPPQQQLLPLPGTGLLLEQLERATAAVAARCAGNNSPRQDQNIGHVEGNTSHSLLSLSDLLPPATSAATHQEEANHQSNGGGSDDDPAALTSKLISRRLAALLSSFDVCLSRCASSHLAFRGAEIREGENALFFPQGRRSDSSGRPIYAAFQTNSSSAPATAATTAASTTMAMSATTTTTTTTGAASAVAVVFYLDHDASVLTLPPASSSAGPQQGAGSRNGAPPSPPLLSLSSVGSGGASPSSLAGAGGGGGGLLVRAVSAPSVGSTPGGPQSPALLPGPAVAAASSSTSTSSSSRLAWPDFLVGSITSMRPVASGTALFGGNLTVPVGTSAFVVGVRRIR